MENKKRKKKAADSLAARAERKIDMGAAPKFEQAIEKPRAIGNDNMREALPEMTIPTAPNKVQSTATAVGPTKDVELQANIPMAKGPNLTSTAQVQNPTTIAETGKYTPEKKPMTFEEMLEAQRKQAIQEKTDAVKMQKYHALNDVFNALGKMGGTAIGSAVGGGKVFDNATPVGEYQPNRNYINAFEKAKQANDRLRAIEDKEFTLAYNKAQRDEERAYQAAEKKAEREYRAQLDALDKQWQKDMLDYRAKIDAALAANNMELKAQYEAEQAAKEQEYWKERQAITHKGEMDIKNLSKEIVAMQMGGAYNPDGTGRTGKPFFFDDDTVAYIDSEDMQALRDRFIGSQLGNAYIDEDNFNRFLAQNPAIVATYLNKVGKDSSFYTPPVEVAPAAKSSWKPNPNKFYGYGNGYLPSNKQTKKEEAQEEYSIENDPMRDLLSK